MNTLIACMVLLAIIVWGAVLSRPAPPPVQVQHIVIQAAPALVRPSPTPGCRYAAQGTCSGGGWGE